MVTPGNSLEDSKAEYPADPAKAIVLFAQATQPVVWVVTSTE
jgi:hypothetical protein